ncbi:hypothetical protein UCD39_13510 [Nitrospirillum sp. BR 11752]|nr:hypothetical protein [Nitrospirillum sp. BR 11752]
MMVMWSGHSGADDKTGRGAIKYLLDESVYKEGPDGKKSLVLRDPKPEILRGDPKLMAALISSIPFERKYSSAVLSFAASDINVAEFNAGDKELRHKINDLIDGFEDVAFAGIPRENRPMTLWSTHTHLGRLELNVVIPRAILHGGRLKSVNPCPPGAEARNTYDALRDYWNWREGWADPTDPARARPVAPAGHLAKAGRADQREELAAGVMAEIQAGRISDRAGVSAWLAGQGWTLRREGADYLSVVGPAAPHGLRLKGPLFSSTFQKVSDLPAGLIPAAAAEATPARRTDPAEAAARLAALVQRRGDYHRSRFSWGGDEKTRSDLALRRAKADGREWVQRKATEWSKKRYPLPPAVLARLRFIDPAAGRLVLTGGTQILAGTARIRTTNSRDSELHQPDDPGGQEPGVGVDQGPPG